MKLYNGTISLQMMLPTNGIGIRDLWKRNSRYAPVWIPPPPTPARARAAISDSMLGAAAQKALPNPKKNNIYPLGSSYMGHMADRRW